MAYFKILPAAALAGLLLSAQASLAAEGGFSFYLPGSAGDIALARSSEPGHDTIIVAALADLKKSRGRDAFLRVILSIQDDVAAEYTTSGNYINGRTER